MSKIKRPKLLGIDTNAKTVKGRAKGYRTALLYLAPSDLSGVINLCPAASAGCRAACLFTAGHGGMTNKATGVNRVRDARIAKTVYYKNDKAEFLAQLEKEIASFIKSAAKAGVIPTVRLNGTSDIAWESQRLASGKSLIETFPQVQFYDYTKIKARAVRWAQDKLPDNYHLTFSLNEENLESAKQVAKLGGNVAVVFSNDNFPETFMGLPVINGDEDDLRFLDPKGVIVGLKAKGDAKKDYSGFVIDTVTLQPRKAAV
jgi:hypothetical protein